MSLRAWAYIVLIYVLGAIVFLAALFNQEIQPGQWLDFAILTALATLAQITKSEAPSNQSYHSALILFFAGALLLDPLQFGLLITFAHLIEWLKEHRTQADLLKDWYIQPFNISMHIIIGISVRIIFDGITPDTTMIFSASALLAATVGALGYTLLNHLMVGIVLSLARGIPIKESGTFEIENLLIDFVMLILGYVVAILYQLNRWLILPPLAPLYLIRRALSVPKLKEQANTDPKTGLWNAEYFVKALDVELSRCKRFDRPLTVVMADIDFLRNINNTYGHLGGDAVLIGVANILKGYFRDYDIVSRFGGEEFAILLPETDPQDAYGRIESIRAEIKDTEFISPISKARIKATMSFGIAGLNGYDSDTKEVIHRADIAVYNAKLEGRNRTSIYTDQIAETLGVGIQSLEDALTPNKMSADRLFDGGR